MADEAAIIKEKLPIQDVIGSYIKLEKAGVNFKARCPFHQEKTPSFFISPSRNTFYCFGCHAKGDIFEFVEKIEGVDFRGALKLLAEKAGIQLVGYDNESKSERNKLHSLLEDACQFYELEFTKKSEAKEYMNQRGVLDETLNKFRIGYAPASWRGVSSYLIAKGYNDTLIDKAGLSKPGNRGSYDRFRGRIMFPIFDSSGRVVAFSGRIFDTQAVGEGATPAKYINSPETELFHKSKILYGFNFAKEGIRKWSFAILVEGQMDLIMSHQAGFTNTVALSGTALTEDQLSNISRFTDRILLSLDADSAGVIASGRSAMLALQKGFDVKVAQITGGKDPADIIKENPAEWKRIVREGSHVVEYYLSIIESKKLDQRKFRLETVKAVLPFIEKIQSAVDREHFLELVASRLKLSKDSLLEEISKMESSTPPIKSNENYNISSDLSRKEKLMKLAIGFYMVSEKGEAKEEVEKELREIFGNSVFDKIVNDEGYVNEAAFEIENSKMDINSKDEFKQIVSNLRKEFLKEREALLREEIKKYEDEGDDRELKMAMEEYQKLANELHKTEKT